MIISDQQYKKFNFPVGEMHIQLINPTPNTTISVEWRYQGNEDIIELLLFFNALKEMRIRCHSLYIPYVPFSRQDRVNVKGECFSLKMFAELVNGLGASRVIIHDPHSDVTPALINNCSVITQDEIFWFVISDMYGVSQDKVNKFWLVSPDAGALKKIYKLAARFPNRCIGVIECSKKRDVRTGEITNTVVPRQQLDGYPCIIVDDICDGGRTFIEIAKLLKNTSQDTKEIKASAGKVILCVTHGFFTKGMKVFDGLIDEIYTSTGKVYPHETTT